MLILENFRFNYCRQQYKQQLPIGGPGQTIEIDETCWVKQKHNRGMPKRKCGTSEELNEAKVSISYKIIMYYN